MDELDALKEECQRLRARLDTYNDWTQALLDGLPGHVRLRYCPDRDDDAHVKTPLHLMCEHGVASDDGLLQHIDRLEGETNAIDGLDRTPLMVACWGGHQDCVEVLLSCSATDLDLTLEKCNGELMSALHHAIAGGHVGCVQTLLRHGASITVPGNVEGDGYTALHFACDENQPASAAALIEHKADLEGVTSDGCTALHVASCRGSADCLSVLLAAGANASATTNFSETGLHSVSSCWSLLATYVDERERAACAQLLLTAGTDVNAPDASGRTPVKAACRNGIFALTRTLLEGGAEPCEAEPQRESLAWNTYMCRTSGARSTSHAVVRSRSYARCHSLLRRAKFLGEASRVAGGLDWTPATQHLMTDCDRAVVEAARRALLLVGKRRPALSLPRDALFKVLAIVATCERV